MTAIITRIAALPRPRAAYRVEWARFDMHDEGIESRRPRASGAERRAAPRYSLVEPAEVEIASWNELVALYTKDISHGGMFVGTDEPPARDTQVAVRVRLPGEAGTLALEGVVVHVVTAAQAGAMGCAAGFGIQFTNLTRERRSALQRLVEHAKEVAAERSIAEPRVPPELGSTRTRAAPPPSTPPSARASRPSRSELAARSEQLAAGLKRRDATAASPAHDEHRAVVEEALRLVADKHYSAAIERLELALQRAPEPRLRVLLCMVQARQALIERDFPRARAHYETVLELQPGHEVAKRELLMLTALRR